MTISLRPGARRGEHRRAASVIAGATLVALVMTGQVVAQGVSTTAARTPLAVAASASATGLFPGATRPLAVTLKNRSSRTLTVLGVRVRVKGDPRRPNCAPTDHVRPSELSRRVRIAAGRQRTFALQITMSEAAPNTCQGAAFPLTIAVRTP